MFDLFRSHDRHHPCRFTSPPRRYLLSRDRVHGRSAVVIYEAELTVEKLRTRKGIEWMPVGEAVGAILPEDYSLTITPTQQ